MTVGTMDEIDVLLQEIYEYLQKRKQNVELTEDDKRKAENLIERSKEQLQKIAFMKNNDNDIYEFIETSSFPKVSSTNSRTYMVMSGPSQSVLDSPPPLPAKNIPKPMPNPPNLTEPICPYKELSAKELSNQIKQGILLMRRKVFIIDRWSKVFGAVYENWLLIYWSSKDAKPFYTFDLKQYKAEEFQLDPVSPETIHNEEAISKKSKIRKASSFKVFKMESENKKNYMFVATTYKDMRQWVVNINRGHDKALESIKHQIQNDDDGNEDRYYERVIANTSLQITNEERISPTPSPSLSIDCIYDVVGLQNNPPELSSESFKNSDEITDEDDNTYYEISMIRQESEKNNEQLSPVINQDHEYSDTIIPSIVEKSGAHKNSLKMENAIMSNIIKITRPKVPESPQQSLETFTGNLKLKTFQANTTKEDVTSTSTNMIDDISKTIDPLKSKTLDSELDKRRDVEKTISKKIPPVAPKPKKFIKKLPNCK